MQAKCSLFAILMLIMSVPSLTTAQQEFLSVTNNKELKIKIESTAPNSYAVTLDDNHISGASVFALENPARIVVDLAKVNGRNESYSVPKNKLIKKVRVGHNSDRLRIVLDIDPKAETPKFSWTTKPGSLLISLESGSAQDGSASSNEATKPSESSSSEQVSVATPEAARPEPTLRPTPHPTSVPTATSTPLPSPSATPRQTATPEPPASPLSPTPAYDTSAQEQSAGATSSSNTKQSVLSFSFQLQSPDNTPALIVQLTQHPSFRLQKRDDRTYILSVSNSSLAMPELKLAHFPSQNFVGFAYVIGEMNNDSAQIKIGVDRSTRLAASANNANQIIITTGFLQRR